MSIISFVAFLSYLHILHLLFKNLGFRDFTGNYVGYGSVLVVPKLHVYNLALFTQVNGFGLSPIKNKH